MACRDPVDAGVLPKRRESYRIRAGRNGPSSQTAAAVAARFENPPHLHQSRVGERDDVSRDERPNITSKVRSSIGRCDAVTVA